uniref:Uncharacterized protein n=1 Tax=Noctiluca scintillans TaxID=2966 RepID=A0A7S1A5G8_NOCSC|mmetsp:Transcript_32596/g.87508  ORF Transcript_32596/g.87508 Transcript_32596/m.87508 type:complete len:264 (+) Transcript_32596:85-876(+)
MERITTPSIIEPSMLTEQRELELKKNNIGVAHVAEVGKRGELFSLKRSFSGTRIHLDTALGEDGLTEDEWRQLCEEVDVLENTKGEPQAKKARSGHVDSVVVVGGDGHRDRGGLAILSRLGETANMMDGEGCTDVMAEADKPPCPEGSLARSYPVGENGCFESPAAVNAEDCIQVLTHWLEHDEDEAEVVGRRFPELRSDSPSAVMQLADAHEATDSGDTVLTAHEWRHVLAEFENESESESEVESEIESEESDREADEDDVD